MQQTIIVPTCTILWPRLYFITIIDVQDISKNVCNSIQAKTSIQRHPVGMTDANYDYILDEIERLKKMISKWMWVLTVMMNYNDDINNNAIFNVFLHYITVKNEYVNII